MATTATSTPVKLFHTLRIESLPSPTDEEQLAFALQRQKIKSPVSRFATSGSLSPKLLPLIHEAEEPKRNDV